MEDFERVVLEKYEMENIEEKINVTQKTFIAFSVCRESEVQCNESEAQSSIGTKCSGLTSRQELAKKQRICSTCFPSKTGASRICHKFELLGNIQKGSIINFFSEENSKLVEKLHSN